MEVLIRDLVKERKKQMGMTTERISEVSGVPVDTISYLVSGKSKSPSVYSVGPICAALGVSLDRYFGINTKPESDIEKENADLRQRMKFHRKLTVALLVVTILALALWLRIDLAHADLGLFRW